MQVEFPSKYLPTQSHEYISSRKLNGSNIYDRKVVGDPRMYSPYDEILHENRNSTIPIHRITINSKDPPLIPASLNNQTHKFREPIVDPIIDKNGTIYQQIATKLHRQRSNPTVGSIQSSYNIDHQRSASPALSKIIEEDRISSSSSSTTDSAVSNNESSFLPRDFNSDIFYQSVFKPELFTDDRNQRYIEMKLDVHDYTPDEIQVSMNDNDLIVQVERTNFYKQITLPSNTDATSLSLHHHDKKLHIKVKLLDEYSSFKYI
jgi:HSP20 family molecular chaperone IbpA